MKTHQVSIQAQYVRQTSATGSFPDGKGGAVIHPLHEVQKRMKLDYEQLPEITIITAPTGTGKSYAFPFPVLNSKKEKPKIGEEGLRALIVLPTNALINELHQNFAKTFPNLNTVKVTGEALNQFEVKGFQRYEKFLELCDVAEGKRSDLVITNPDIVNYAMHGGYHEYYWNKKKTGKREFPNLMEKFDYFIFDEYHLYDEAQIANLLTLICLNKLLLPNRRFKYFFVSATPESSLKILLEEQGYQVEEIIEEIVNEPEKARAIHGELAVEFCSTTNIQAAIQEKYSEIRHEIVMGRKCLIILNGLRTVQELAIQLKIDFPNEQIYESTGYANKQENTQDFIEQADIIVATNKAEVGVNYGVEYCIMEPGKFFQNFVQRFGRVSRGKLNGKVVVFVNNVILGKLKKNFPDTTQLQTYYPFMAVMRSLLESKTFYTDAVPSYLGEYMWCIRQNIWDNQTHEARILLENQLEQFGFFAQAKVVQRYQLFQAIHARIWKLKKEVWQKWWKAYRHTYFTFRDGSKVVEIWDKVKDLELSYSLEWILQHKEVLEIEEYEKNGRTIQRYWVGELKERDRDLQYKVSTIPQTELEEGFVSLLNYRDVNTTTQLRKAFKRSIEEVYQKKRNALTESEIAEKELLVLVKLLETTFSRKRLVIDKINPFL